MGNVESVYDDGCLEDVYDKHQQQKLRKIVQDYKGTITSYKKVNNYYLKSMYDLKKDEYTSKYGASQVREMTLIHSTSAINVPEIIKDNFDWRRVVRSKYGKGVSFSDDADYANCHSNRSNGTCRAFIIAKVLVSNICRGHQDLRTPHCTSDTAWGPHVFVKFRDNEFLPEHVLYYSCSGISDSKYYRRPRGINYLF